MSWWFDDPESEDFPLFQCFPVSKSVIKLAVYRFWAEISWSHLALFWWDFYTWWLENKTNIWHLFNKSPWESILVGLHNEISDDWLETVWSHMIPESLDVPCFILTCWIPSEPVPNILARSAIWPKVTPRRHQLVNIWLVWKKNNRSSFSAWNDLPLKGWYPFKKRYTRKSLISKSCR